jgi:hypothetical protein
MNIESFESEMKLTGVVLPLRSSLIRENGKAIMISPVKLSETEVAKLKANGGVTDIVAPNLIHHLFAPKAKDSFPNATLWCVEGLEKKRADVKWDKQLTKAQWPYSDFLEVLPLKGAPELNETVFFHKKSRTLIVTDLCFNIQNPRGFLSPIILRIFDNYKKFAVSKLIGRYVKDKAAFRNSMNELLKWDFDRIAMSHGSTVESGGKEMLRAALTRRGLIS